MKIDAGKKREVIDTLPETVEQALAGTFWYRLALKTKLSNFIIIYFNFIFDSVCQPVLLLPACFSVCIIQSSCKAYFFTITGSLPSSSLGFRRPINQ